MWHSGGSYGDLLVGSDEHDHLEPWHRNVAPGDDHGSEAHAEGTRASGRSRQSAERAGEGRPHEARTRSSASATATVAGPWRPSMGPLL